MRIGHFVSLFPQKSENVQIYGAARAAHNLCKKLAERDFDVRVFVPFTGDLVERHDGMTVHFYKSLLKIGIMNVSRKLLSDPLSYDIDVVHIHNDTPMSVIAGLRYARKRGKPVVVTWHGDWIEGYGGALRRSGVWISNRYLVDRVLSCANAIITPSVHYVEESRFLKSYRKKLIEIPNGVDLEDFNVPYSKEECREKLGLNTAKNVVLFLSALYPLKGPQVLLEAIPKIVREQKDVAFVFVGGGDVDKYRKLSEELGVQRYVEFRGYVEEELKPLYYKAADIFVLPSIETFEVFPIVLLEASVSGLPMVVSDLETFKCIIEDGHNGLFTKRGDEGSLADAIVYLLENEAVRRKMGENARKKAESFTWDRIAEMTGEVYRSVVK